MDLIFYMFIWITARIKKNEIQLGATWNWKCPSQARLKSGLLHFLLFKKWNEPTFNRIYFHIIKFTKSCDKFYLHKQKIPKKRNYTAVVWCFLVTKCTSNGNFLISFLKVSCQCQQDYIVCIFHTQFSLHEIL